MKWSLREFLHDRSGSYVLMTALAAVPLVLGLGIGVDYSRASNARLQLQDLSDSAALAVAASGVTDVTQMRQIAQNYITANSITGVVENPTLASFTTVGTAISISVTGSVKTSFMQIANVPKVDLAAKSQAERAITGSLEVSLVLDNTYSMIEADAKGVKKIDALKSASTTLVKTLMNDPNAKVKIALVPYADYVNVGTQNRSESWVAVPADVTTTKPSVCTTINTKQTCDKAPTYPCTTVTDGVVQAATCGGGNINCVTTSVPEYQSCTKESSSTTTWFGCIGSRKVGKLKLLDTDKSVTYPGYNATSRACPTPIVTLTSDKASLLTNIAAMNYANGSYKPLTYIPAGLLWGLNTLSPDAPFTQGLTFDPANKDPRKVIVLMTDGDNTLRYNNNVSGVDSTDGKTVKIPVDADGNFTTAGLAQAAITNADTLTLCANAKLKGIEIFSVALQVDSVDGKAILQTCATDASHYYDATDAAALAAAFGDIATSLSVVRLVR